MRSRTTYPTTAWTPTEIARTIAVSLPPHGRRADRGEDDDGDDALQRDEHREDEEGRQRSSEDQHVPPPPDSPRIRLPAGVGGGCLLEASEPLCEVATGRRVFVVRPGSRPNQGEVEESACHSTENAPRGRGGDRLVRHQVRAEGDVRAVAPTVSACLS